jgi:hypothetical protein
VGQRGITQDIWGFCFGSSNECSTAKSAKKVGYIHDVGVMFGFNPHGALQTMDVPSLLIYSSNRILPLSCLLCCSIGFVCITILHKCHEDRKKLLRVLCHQP